MIATHLRPVVLTAVALVAWPSRGSPGEVDPPSTEPQTQATPVRPDGQPAQAPRGSPAPPPPTPAEEAQPVPAAGGAVPASKPAKLDPSQVLSGDPPPDDGRNPPDASWYDAGHTLIGRLVFAPVLELDRFFSDETELDPERSRSFMRFRNAVRFRDDGRPLYTPDLRIEARFPGVNQWLDRFRLVLAGVADDTLDSLYSDSSGGAPYRFRDTRGPSAELRFGAYRGMKSTLDVGAGLLFRYPPGIFARVRYRLAIPVGDLFLTRFATSGFWRTDTHFGARMDLGLERPLGRASLVRLTNSSEVAQRTTQGVEYGSELAWLHAFNPFQAMALGVGFSGATRAPNPVDRYRIFTRFRHDVLRRWIFVELEPEVGWPWSPQRGRYRELAVTVRLELQFQGDKAVTDMQDRREAEHEADPDVPATGR